MGGRDHPEAMLIAFAVGSDRHETKEIALTGGRDLCGPRITSPSGGPDRLSKMSYDMRSPKLPFWCRTCP
jgi:hypothetical protein